MAGRRLTKWVVAVPVLVVYLFLQRQIVDGVTAGVTKG